MRANYPVNPWGQDRATIMDERHQVLIDQEFWQRLEYDATRWLQQSHDRTISCFWIDGFLPEGAKNTKRGVDVEGTAWVCRGAAQFPWRFVARVPQNLLRPDDRHFQIESLALDQEQEVLIVAVARLKSVNI